LKDVSRKKRTGEKRELKKEEEKSERKTEWQIK